MTATEKTATYRAPITLMHEGKYVPPGTEVTLPVSEVNKLTQAFGVYDGPPLMTDPGNTQAIGVDGASIAALNEFAANYGGNGKTYTAIGEEEADDELDEMTKEDLIAYAEMHHIEVDKTAKKADIKAAIISAGK